MIYVSEDWKGNFGMITPIDGIIFFIPIVVPERVCFYYKKVP